MAWAMARAMAWARMRVASALLGDKALAGAFAVLEKRLAKVDLNC